MGNERQISCGGFVPRKPKGLKEPIRLDLRPRNPNVNLKISDISRRMASNVPSIFVDLLEIATYVYCADQALTRGGNGVRNVGAKWRRSLSFFIPVRYPEIWSSREVREVLQDTLGFLSDDEYNFSFKRLTDPPPVELYFEFGVGPEAGFSVDEVVLFSGGLDSFGGAVHQALVEKKNVGLVSHRSTPKIASKQRALGKELSQRCESTGKTFHIPVWINKDKSLSREFTQRTRSFLYVCLGATVASMFGLSKIRIYENGIVSFNLPISAQVIGSRATRVTHPRVLEGFAQLFSILRQEEFKVENPFLWKTKAQVVRVIADAGCSDLIKHTVSCSQVYGRTKLLTHCGVCSQCIDRRFGTQAAGHGTDDPAEMYKVNLLTGELKQGTTRTMVESYVRTAQEINDMSDQDFFIRFGEISRVLRHISGSADDNASKVLDLHRRHAREVLGVLDAAIGEHAAEIRKGTLSDSCLLSLSLPKKHKNSYRPEGKRYVFCKEGDYWTLEFEGKITRLKDSKGLGYISILLKNRNQEFSTYDLQSLLAAGVMLPLVGRAEEVSDKPAIVEYKSRLHRLETKLELAKETNDLSRQISISEETEALKQEIRRSTGLGGRLRRVSDESERARQAISAAIRRAMKAIAESHFSLWQHLQNSLRIGHFLIYAPDRPIFWET